MVPQKETQNCSIRWSNIDRDDRQNWRSAQRISFRKVQSCLEAQQLRGSHVEGTRLYVKIVWYHAEIFCSPVASLATRIEYAAIICLYLAIWRNHTEQTKNLTLKRNFISRETFFDTIASCHFAISMIIYRHDNFPNLPCNLKIRGTDCVECYFSSNEQWVGNHHNYSFGTLQRNRSDQIRLEKIRTDPNGPKFAKPHPKGECIWTQQYEVVTAPANLMDYPTDEMVTSSWENGIFAAQQLAKDIGMKPSTSDEISGIDEHSAFPPFLNDNPRNLNQWFYQPFTEFAREFGDIGGEDEDDDIANLEDVSGNISVDTSTVPSDNVDFIFEPSEGYPFDVGDVDEDNNTASKVLRASSKVKIPDTEKEIYKSTLVALLNRDPKLSRDHLKRVRQRTEYEKVSPL